MMNPNYPVLEGYQALTLEWSLFLPARFNRRIEDGDLYIWKPGLTLVLAAWGNTHSETAAERAAQIRREASPGAYDLRQEEIDGLLYFSYRLPENSEDKRVDALYAFVLAVSRQLQAACYFDDESTCDLARRVLRSVTHTENFDRGELP